VKNYLVLAMGAVLQFALVTAAPLQAANLVVNPGFETGDFTGWTPIPNADPTLSFFGVQGGGVGNGSAFAAYFAGATPGFDGISQTFVTTPGQTYTLSYFLNIDGSSPISNEFQVYFNGVQVQDLINQDTAGSYVQYTFASLNATGASATLLFQANNLPSFSYLDDVSLTLNAAPGVPEPASLVLTFAGILSLGAWRKFRRA
jgi:hypothetical protein